MTGRPARHLRLLPLVGLLAGCGQRGAEPPIDTGGKVVVGVAVTLLAAVAGALLTWPVWTRPPRRWAASAVLALQAGGAAVATVVLGAMAVRSYRLHDRPDEEAADAVTGGLIRLTTIDGDTELFALLFLFVVLVGLLVVTATAVTARLAAASDAVSRWVTTAILGVELLGAGTLLALGWRALDEPVLVRWSLVALPLLVAAFVTAWPDDPVEAEPEAR